MLHEVAHLNQWDAFALGPGSLLEWVAKRWVWISGVMTLLPVGAALIIAWVADFTSFVTPRHGLMNLAAIAAHELSWLPILLVTAIGLTIAMFIHLIWCAGVFAPLIAAIWTAELSADRHAAARLGEAGTLLRSFKPPPEGHRLRNLLKTGLTHPPVRLRRWLLRHPSQWRSLAVTLAVFPAGYLVQLALFVISFLVMDPRMRAPVGLAPAGAYQFGQPALNALIGGSHALAAGPFLIGGMLLLLWPAMTQRQGAPRPWLPYLLLAAPMLAVAFWGWTVPLEMGAPGSLSE